MAADSVTAVTLHWPHNFFEFEFAALNFAQTDKNQYAYRLEGWEEAWNYVGARPFGRYTNLPGGSYVLRLKGSNSDGVWNEVGSSILITITPPFWQTWWFRGLTAVLLLAVLVGVSRLRLTAVQRRNRQLQQQVAERNQALAQRTLELERRRKIAEGLREILVRLNGNHALDDSLHYIAHQAATLTGAAEVVIFQYEPGDEVELLANSSGRPLNGVWLPVWTFAA
ncbi:MAG: hypothetical protein HC804_06075 [Anaerolineae bacterium]|nr:hypothetical protein [Anaerolineae bacterium]